MSKRGSNSELFAHENDALPLGHMIWFCTISKTLFLVPSETEAKTESTVATFISMSEVIKFATFSSKNALDFVDTL